MKTIDLCVCVCVYFTMCYVGVQMEDLSNFTSAAHRKVEQSFSKSHVSAKSVPCSNLEMS